MERDQIDNQLKRIFADLFDLAEEAISLQSSPDSLEKWDSLGQVNLIAALEEHFEILIPPEQQLDMLNFELIGDVIQDLV